MPHGSTEKCEPNFTPLLDLVLQLVMFFMLCANFVMEQTSDQIKLPEAVTGKVRDKSEAEEIILNISKDGKVLLTPAQWRNDIKTLDNPIQVENYMKGEAAVEKRRTGKSKPEAVVRLRVDQYAPWELTAPIRDACVRAGYEKIHLGVQLYTSQ